MTVKAAPYLHDPSKPFTLYVPAVIPVAAKELEAVGYKDAVYTAVFVPTGNTEYEFKPGGAPGAGDIITVTEPVLPPGQTTFNAVVVVITPGVEDNKVNLTES